jgi:hypothetical protein
MEQSLPTAGHPMHTLGITGDLPAVCQDIVPAGQRGFHAEAAQRVDHRRGEMRKVEAALSDALSKRSMGRRDKGEVDIEEMESMGDE